MFCCGLQPLHYTSMMQQDFIQVFINEEKPLKKRLQENKSQIILPSAFILTLQNPFAIQANQNTISQSDYCVKVSQQTKTIEIKERKKQNLESLWKVLKDNETDQIVQDDIFGFGAYDFKVYQIGKRNQIKLQQKQYETEMNCRICFTNQTSEKNPLMSFCQCIGSVKYQHLHCLKQWLKEGSIKNQFEKWSYIEYSKLNCNICKKPWLQKLKHNKKNYYLFEAQQSQEQKRLRNGNKICLALPTFSESDDKQTLLIVKFYLTPTSNFIIGGDEDQCDLILDNMNISSIQCQLTLQNQKLILKDLNSYHGTGIKMRNRQQKQSVFSTFSSKKGIVLKYNGVYIRLTNKNSFFSCLDPEQTYKVLYNNYSG